MDAEHIFAVCWGVSFFIIGIVVLLGIADELMAGYNTASEEERKKYNIVFLLSTINSSALLPRYFSSLLSHSPP